MRNEIWFFEQQSLGKWWPAISTDKPEIRNGRLLRSSGPGKSVRYDPVLVNPCYHHLTLDQLAALYSPEGLFLAIGRGAAVARREAV